MKRRASQFEEPEITQPPTIGCAVPAGSAAKQPDDSYRRSRVGFRIPKRKVRVEKERAR